MISSSCLAVYAKCAQASESSHLAVTLQVRDPHAHPATAATVVALQHALPWLHACGHLELCGVPPSSALIRQLAATEPSLASLRIDSCLSGSNSTLCASECSPSHLAQAKHTRSGSGSACACGSARAAAASARQCALAAAPPRCPELQPALWRLFVDVLAPQLQTLHLRGCPGATSHHMLFVCLCLKVQSDSNGQAQLNL